jgi:hypothetical protein
MNMFLLDRPIRSTEHTIQSTFEKQVLASLGLETDVEIWVTSFLRNHYSLNCVFLDR